MLSSEFKTLPGVFKDLKTLFDEAQYNEILSHYVTNSTRGLYVESHIRRSAKSNFNPLSARLCFLLIQFIEFPSYEEVLQTFSQDLISCCSDNECAELMPANPLLAAVCCLDVLSHAHQRLGLPRWVSAEVTKASTATNIPTKLQQRIIHHQKRAILAQLL